MVLSWFLPDRPSPIPGLPVIPGGTLWGGHLHLLREPNFQVALEKWAVQHADENGRCTFWMGPTTPSLSVTHPDDAQVLLKGTAYRSTFGLMSQHFTQLFGEHNVGLLNGSEWKQQRHKIIRALHSAAVVARHEQAFRDTTHHFVENIMTKMEEGGGEWQCEDLLVLMKGLSMDCFGQAALHTEFGSCQHLLNPDRHTTTTSRAAPIGPALDRLTQEMMRRVTKDILLPMSHIYSLPTPANQQYAQDKEVVLSFLQQLIRERQHDLENNDLSKQVPADLLTGFLEHFRIPEDDSGQNLEQDENELVLTIAQSIMGLLFAGYETSSVTLTYALYLLSQHPNVRDHCLQEIEFRSEMVYLEAVVKETLRLYPPAISTNRTADRDLELPARNGSDAIQVPTGTYLYVPIWIIQRSPDYYKNPREFQPERWVEPSATGDGWQARNAITDHANNAWLPFSAGARACPGQRFALQGMTTILSVLLPRLNFVPPHQYVLTPHREGFIQVPQGGIPVTISVKKR